MLGAAAGAAALAGCDGTTEGVLAQALADGANVATVDVIAQLAALSGGPVSHAAGAPPAIAIAQGYHTPGDGGGGVFAWVEGAIAAGDGGTRFPAANAGAWVRLFSGALDVRWFGAIAGDATAAATNSAAFAAALACPAASIVSVPNGQFFLAETLRLRRSVILQGAGMNHQTILQLPAGSSVVIEYVTDNPYPATDNNNTVIRDLMIASTGWEMGDPASVDPVTFAGPSSEAPGLKMNIYSTLENVRIERFGGTGIEIITDLVAGTGNTSWWRIRNCLVDSCGGHGLHVDGGDANGGLCLGLVVGSVGGCGILDSSAGGGTYVGCYMHNPTGGGYSYHNAQGITEPELSTGNNSTFVGCFSECERPARLFQGATYWGGTCAENFTADSSALASMGAGVVWPFQVWNPNLPDPQVKMFVGNDATRAFGWTTNTHTDNVHWNVAWSDAEKVWSVEAGGLRASYYTTRAAFVEHARGIGLQGFPSLLLGEAAGPNVKVTVATSMPAEPGEWGDRVYQAHPVVGEPVGWVYAQLPDGTFAWRALGILA